MLLSYGANPNIRVYGEMGTNATLRPPLAELLVSNDNIQLEEVQLLLKFGARVIMKTQFRDPDGLLNCLNNLSYDSTVFQLLLDAAEEFDPCMIRRNKDITIKQRSNLLDKSSKPLSLQHITRSFFRRHFKQKMPESVPQLEIPQMLREYLLFEIYWRLIWELFCVLMISFWNSRDFWWQNLSNSMENSLTFTYTIDILYLLTEFCMILFVDCLDGTSDTTLLELSSVRFCDICLVGTFVIFEIYSNTGKQFCKISHVKILKS